MITTIKLGKYIHFEGNEYEATNIVNHSQTFETMVLYHATNKKEIWVCPLAFWNEAIEYNGQIIKRFTHIDEFLTTKNEADKLPEGVHNRSKPEDKINLFLSLFVGREDVYAKRWDSAKTGRGGYSPDCYNFWKDICPKKHEKKIKCGECSAQKFKPFDEKTIGKHLLGELTAGVYPMLHDETCRFLAFDFDGKDYTQNELKRDVSAIREVCDEFSISMAVERSRSGMGIHFWIFGSVV